MSVPPSNSTAALLVGISGLSISANLSKGSFWLYSVHLVLGSGTEQYQAEWVAVSVRVSTNAKRGYPTIW